MLAALLSGGLVAAAPGSAAEWVAPADTGPARVVTPQITGGTAVRVSRVPWQARVRMRLDGKAFDDPSAARGRGCGAVVLNATTVVTAMHCVTDRRKPVPGRSMRVDTGMSRHAVDPAKREAPQPVKGDTPQTVGVTLVRRHPGYPNPVPGPATPEQLADDVATLRLSKPLRLDANTRPIAVADPGQAPSGGPALVSGFGLQSAAANRPDGRLYALDMQLVDAALPPNHAGAVNALYVAARSPSGSSCPGDSGGPLVAGGRLLGIVSSGDETCGPGTTSFYTSLAAPEIRDFVLGDGTPPRAPRGGTTVSLSGSYRAGDALRCAPGAWTNAPTFGYTFQDPRDGAVLQAGPSDTYLVGDADVGRTIACRATAANAGGVGRSGFSGVTPPVLPRPAPPTPTTNPARLRVQVAAGASRVRRRGRIAFVIAVDNVGGEAARSVRTCVRVSSRFTVSKRRGGRLRGGRLCWTTSSLERRTLKRFELRAKSNAKRGRVTVAKVTASAAGVQTARANRKVTVRR